jgi:hypothetical protein
MLGLAALSSKLPWQPVAITIESTPITRTAAARRLRSSDASFGISTRQGRTAVAPDCSVVTDM